MRHGHSPSAAEAGVAQDALRPLSPVGRAQARRQAGALLNDGELPALLLHSPLLRAAQTAEELAALLRIPPQAFAPLSNDLPPEELARELSAPLARARALLIVGHQPQVGELCAWLCESLVDFKPGGLAALEAEALSQGSARLLWQRDPPS